MTNQQTDVSYCAFVHRLTDEERSARFGNLAHEHDELLAHVVGCQTCYPLFAAWVAEQDRASPEAERAALQAPPRSSVPEFRDDLTRAVATAVDSADSVPGDVHPGVLLSAFRVEQIGATLDRGDRTLAPPPVEFRIPLHRFFEAGVLSDALAWAGDVVYVVRASESGAPYAVSVDVRPAKGAGGTLRVELTAGTHRVCVDLTPRYPDAFAPAIPLRPETPLRVTLSTAVVE